jgi:hypothetical protein
MHKGTSSSILQRWLFLSLLSIGFFSVNASYVWARKAKAQAEYDAAAAAWAKDTAIDLQAEAELNAVKKDLPPPLAKLEKKILRGLASLKKKKLIPRGAPKTEGVPWGTIPKTEIGVRK